MRSIVRTSNLWVPNWSPYFWNNLESSVGLWFWHRSLLLKFSRDLAMVVIFFVCLNFGMLDHCKIFWLIFNKSGLRTFFGKAISSVVAVTHQCTTVLKVSRQSQASKHSWTHYSTTGSSDCSVMIKRLHLPIYFQDRLVSNSHS